MANTKIADNTVTIQCRFSFPHVFQPARISKRPDSPVKYSASIMWPKTDKTTTAIMKAAYDAAIAYGTKEKWGGKGASKHITDTIQDGDKKRSAMPEYKGMYFVNAKTDRRPSISKTVNGKLSEIIDEGEFYAGCYGKASISLFAYEAEGSRGVAVGLNHVLKTKEGDPLTSRISAEDAFGDDLEDDGLGGDDFDDFG